MSELSVRQLSYRLVLLGSVNCGKTSILRRFLLKTFDAKYTPTVEDLFTKDFDLHCVELKVEFLDTSGSMQFPAMRRLSITTGNAFLLVYAIDDRSSFEMLKMFVREICDTRKDFATIPIVFAGNKTDVGSEQWQVHRDEVSHYIYCELPKLRAKLVECSCKTNVNIDAIFRTYLELAEVRVAAPMLPAIVSHRRHKSQSPSSSSPVGKSGGVVATVGGGDDKTNNETGSAAQKCAERRKAALGVRKSCDGSFISSIKNSLVESFKFVDKKRPSDATACQYKQFPAQNCLNKSPPPTMTVNAVNFANNTSTRTQKPTTPTTPTPTTTTPHQCNPHDKQRQHETHRVNLETAIRSVLSSSSAKNKARSRSLIWRSSTRANRDIVDVAECLLQ